MPFQQPIQFLNPTKYIPGIDIKPLTILGVTKNLYPSQTPMQFFSFDKVLTMTGLIPVIRREIS